MFLSFPKYMLLFVFQRYMCGEMRGTVQTGAVGPFTLVCVLATVIGEKVAGAFREEVPVSVSVAAAWEAREMGAAGTETVGSAIGP